MIPSRVVSNLGERRWSSAVFELAIVVPGAGGPGTEYGTAPIRTLRRMTDFWQRLKQRKLLQWTVAHGDRHALALGYAASSLDSPSEPTSRNVIQNDDIPYVLMLGEQQRASDYLERHAGVVGASFDWTVMFPATDPIRCEPRFIAVVNELETPDPCYARVCGRRP